MKKIKSPFSRFPASISHNSRFKSAVTAGATVIEARGLKWGDKFIT